MRSRRMTFVDGLRGIAALAVVICHCQWTLYVGSHSAGDFMDWLSKLVSHLAHGVDVFFVISGFVITHSIGEAKVDGLFAGRFAPRRSLRLDPPYWASIAMTLAIIILRQHIGHDAPAMPSLPQIFAHLFYLQGILGFEQINIVCWTLCLEVQFYLIFIVLIMLSDALWSNESSRPGVVRAWGTAGAFVFSLLWAGAILSTPAFITTWFGPHWHKFLIGALIWYAWSGYLPRYMLYAPVLLLGLVISLHRHGPQTLNALVNQGLWSGLATACLFVIAAKFDGFYRWLSWRPLQFLGLISYSLYLVHLPLIAIVRGIQTRVFGTSAAGAISCSVMIVIMSIVAGWIMNLLIERPSIRLASRFKPKKDDLAGGIEGPIPEDSAVLA